MTEQENESTQEFQENPAFQENKEEEKEDYKTKYLRLLADMENMRKRFVKEKQEHVRFATDRALCEFLGPLDNLENALKASHLGSSELQNWAYGFQMIVSQFHEMLQGQGIVPFHAQGELFDPHKHEAIESAEDRNHPAGTILQEFAKGYMSGPRVLRPAKVKVNVWKEEEVKEELSDKEGE